MADEMTKGNFSGRAGAHVANVTRKWREEARAGSKTGIASEANDRREIFGPKPEKPNKTGIATEALDRREIKGCGLKPGTMRKAMDFIKKGEGQINVDIKPEGPKTVGLIPKPQVSTKKFGPVSYQSTKQPVHTSEGMKQRSTKRLGFDAGPVHAEAHTTSLKSEDVQKVMTFVQNDNPSSPGERAKLLGARAAQAAGVRSQRQMADEDIAEVAQKSIEDKKYSGSGPSHPNRMGGYRPQFGPRVPKYVEGETDQRSGPKVSHVSQMPKCEKSSDSKASPLHSEIAARAFGHTGKNMPIHLAPGTVKKAMDFINKDWPAHGFLTPKDLKNRSAKRAREWENESIRSTKMGDKPGDYGKIVEKYPGGFKNLNAVYDRHQKQKEADTTNLDQEKFATPKSMYQPRGGDR